MLESLHVPSKLGTSPRIIATTSTKDVVSQLLSQASTEFPFHIQNMTPPTPTSPPRQLPLLTSILSHAGSLPPERLPSQPPLSLARTESQDGRAIVSLAQHPHDRGVNIADHGVEHRDGSGEGVRRC